MKRRDAIRGLAAGAAAVMAGLARGDRAMATAEGVNPAGDPSMPELMKRAMPTMSGVPIQVVELGGGFSHLSGPGGNILTSKGPDGLLVVDSFVPSRGQDLAKIVKAMAGGGPITLINTHWHFDHSGGNEALAAAGARIVAHKNTRVRLGHEQVMVDFDIKIPPSPAASLPTIGVGDEATLSHAGEEIALVHVAPAHTDTDLVVHLPGANIVHTGDLFSNGFYPNIDCDTGGWIVGMIAAADRLLGLVDAKTRIVPGHGPIAGVADLRAARSMYGEARDKIQPLVEAGKTVEEAIAARPLAAFDGRWDGGFLRSSHFTQLVYRGLAMHLRKA